MLSIYECWAKTAPFQSVVTHGKVSGRVAQILLDDYLSEGLKHLLREGLGIEAFELRAFLGYLVSLHDIGKLEYQFQRQDEEMARCLREMGESIGLPKSPVRHEKTGQMSLNNLWRSLGNSKQVVRMYAPIIGAHHQGKSGCAGIVNESWSIFHREFEGVMRQEFKASQQLPDVRRGYESTVSLMLLSIMILSDWISSGNLFSDAESWIRQEDAEIIIRSRAKQFLKASGLERETISWPDSFAGLWPNIPAEGMRPLQRVANTLFAGTESDDKILFTLIEAPMGEGKTEAGMFAAMQMSKQWDKDGFYVALPTSATSNQMVGRMRTLLGMHDAEKSVRLLHSMAWLVDAKQELWQGEARDDLSYIRQWLEPLRRGMLSQYAVGTVDQAMMAATNAKYSMLRLLGLANKVLVIDEVHAYDLYMQKIIDRLLDWCKVLKIPVVMLSATLPPVKKKSLFAAYTDGEIISGYPVITTVTEKGRVVVTEISETSHKLRVHTTLKPYLDDPSAIAQQGRSLVQDGGCICILMNTVRQAQMVYVSLKDTFDGELMLFHAQFPAKERDELEKRCISRFGKEKSQRPERAILVATQVVEQSLDVDFDAMISAVAPIDLLIQRMGRIHRHENTIRPKGLILPMMQVLVPRDNAFGADGYVYPECLLRSCIDLLSNQECVRIPEDLEHLVADGYDPSKAPPEELEKWLEHLFEDQLKAASGEKYLLEKPEKKLAVFKEQLEFDDLDGEGYLSVKTRCGEASERIALLEPALYERVKAFGMVQGGQKVFAVADKELATLVMERSVSVRKKRINHIKSVYSDTMGAILLSGVSIFPSENGVFIAPDGSSIRFDPELGVIIEEV